MSLEINISKFTPFYNDSCVDEMWERLEDCHDMVLKKEGVGSELLGWVDLPINQNGHTLSDISNIAEEIKAKSDVLIVIGIGGSYLGARATIEFLHSSKNNILKNNRPSVYYVGNNLSSDYVNEVFELLKDVDFCVNVVSKSGTTTEPAIAFRLFKRFVEDRYGKDGAKGRIFVTTDGHSGSLLDMARDEGYTVIRIPSNVGGRYSVLSSVGLLPVAVSGSDIFEIVKGAEHMRERVFKCNKYNPALLYAACRNIAYRHDKKIEILACFEPKFRFMAEWWKQLFAESEGKSAKGLFPASVEYSTDLHSVGQFIQNGSPIHFETFLTIAKPDTDFIIYKDDKNLDNLNYLADKSLDFINKQAEKATLIAHFGGQVPCIVVSLDDNSESSLGQLIYFFEFSCAISCYIMGVNPFDQPGVDMYKNAMFALLGKPGYEDKKSEIVSKL